MRVARQAVEFRDHQRAAQAPGLGHRGHQLRPLVVRAALDLDEALRQREGLGGSEPLDGGLLGFEAKARAALPLGGNSVVSNRLLHRTLQPRQGSTASCHRATPPALPPILAGCARYWDRNPTWAL